VALAKLEIVVESGRKRISAQFNPASLNLTKTTNWVTIKQGETDVGETQFTGGNPASMDIDLFFDTYEVGKDVRTEYTNKILDLMTIEGYGDLHRPPICELQWGRIGTFYKGVLEKVSQNFTLFLEDGTPVRATLKCTFKEWRSDSEESRRLNLQSADVHKRHTVRRGDTLSSIAAQHYRDPTMWRYIANENNLDNPRMLTPGQVLTIPTLSGRRRR